MIIFKDLISGDEMFSDSFPYAEVEDGFFYEVEAAWVTLGDVDVNIGANPSAEEEEEGVESTEKKVVNIVDNFRLNEIGAMAKKDFLGYVKPWLAKIVELLPEDQRDEFKAKAQPAIKYLVGKINDLQFFVGDSFDVDSTMAYAYYKDGSSNPTFLFPKYALKEMKL